MMQIPEAERRKLDATRKEMEKTDLEASKPAMAIRAVLQTKKNEVFETHVKFPSSDPEAGDYGLVYWRRWTAGEVSHIFASEVYQKAIRSTVTLEVMVEGDQKAFFELACDMVSKAMTKRSSITAQELKDADDWRFVKAMWDMVARKSGITGHIVEDTAAFFRD